MGGGVIIVRDAAALKSVFMGGGVSGVRSAVGPAIEFSPKRFKSTIYIMIPVAGVDRRKDIGRWM